MHMRSFLAKGLILTVSALLNMSARRTGLECDAVASHGRAWRRCAELIGNIGDVRWRGRCRLERALEVSE